MRGAGESGPASTLETSPRDGSSAGSGFGIRSTI